MHFTVNLKFLNTLNCPHKNAKLIESMLGDVLKSLTYKIDRSVELSNILNHLLKYLISI